MKAKIVLIRHGMTQGNQEHRYVGTTDEGLLPESVEDLRGMQEFWQKQVPMNGRTVADSVHDEIEIVPGKVTCEQHCQKTVVKSKSSTSAVSARKADGGYSVPRCRKGGNRCNLQSADLAILNIRIMRN